MEIFGELPDRLKSIPHRIAITATSESVVNGYGHLVKFECRVEVRKSRCLYCKMVENDAFPFCPSNGKHRYSDGWVDIASGTGDSPSEAISLTLACI